MIDMEDDVDWGESNLPYWHCEGCGYEDHNKPMPLNRDKFYSKPNNKKMS